jgi:signal transduction histidine kinase
MRAHLPAARVVRTLRALAWQDAASAGALLVGCVLVNRPLNVVGGVPGAATGHPGAREALWWFATAVLVAGVVLRHRWPVPMLTVCAGCVATHLAVDAPLMIIDLAVPVVLYAVAARYGRAVSLSALAGLLLLAVFWILPPAVAGRPPPGLPVVFRTVVVDQTQARSQVQQSAWWSAWSGLLMVGSALAVSWALGAAAHSRGAYLEQLHARARDLERERDQQAALVVAAERGRISRELHDVVAHGLSVMVIQAQGGAAALDNRPGDTRAALDTIVRTGRESLADMRRVLNTVGEVNDAWHPPPGLALLPGLLNRVRLAGTPVRLRLAGTPRPLPSTVDLSGYRIVQEALTNTMKHARTGTAAEVLLRYDDAELGIEITETVGEVGHQRLGVNGSAWEQHGNGLRGMRERVRLLGGRLVVGPVPDGGFAVRAALPVREPDT